MAHHHPTYPYTILNPARREIRLLHFHDSQASFLDEGYHEGFENDSALDIHCSFSIVSLDDSPHYDALSYVWGDATDVCHIGLDGIRVPVTANLYKALSQVRHTTTTLWVDALCINQGDLPERSEQVSLMHKIYSQASTVVISLGQAYSGSDAVIDFIELHGTRTSLHFDTVTQAHGVDFRSEAFQLSLLNFFYLPWWTRIWTAQEWGLAKHAVFLCGQRMLKGHHLQFFAQNSFAHDACCATNKQFSKHAVEGRSVHAGLQKAALVRAQDVFQGWGYRGFIDVLAAFQYRQCFNPRDKVFGLLGLAPESFRSKIALDYNRSPKEVYTDVVLAAIAETGNLNVLSYIYGRRTENLDLPSFVPDFTAAVQERWVPNYLSRCFVTLDYYNACNSSMLDLKLLGTNEATTSAIILDVIQSTAQSPFDASWADKLYEYRRIAGLDAACPPRGCDDMDSFWKTLCGGIYYDYRGASWFRPVANSDCSSYAKWQTWIEGGMAPELEDKDVLDFNRVFSTTIAGRKMATTIDGSLVLAPWHTCAGDVVAIFPGGRVPYILRPKIVRRDSGFAEEGLERSQQYQFIGDSYVHGIMHGETYDATRLETITLISMSNKTLVERWYDANARCEEHRLDEGRLEFEVTKRVIGSCIANLGQTKVKILDVGGGPGRYAIHLAKQGHQITLNDLSERSLSIARQNAEKESVKLGGIVHANALDIANHATQASFDVVICLGPLYHLLNPEERMTVVKNVISLAKPGGYIILAYVSVYAHLRDMARQDPSRLLKEWTFYEGYLQSGKYNRRAGNESFHVYPKNLEEELGVAAGQASVIKTVSCEGFLGFNNAKALANLSDSEMDRWVEVIMRSASEPETLNSADHILVVLQKPE